MNNQRRKRISQSIKTLHEAQDKLAKIIEEQKAKIEAASDNEDEVIDALGEIVENLEETVSGIDEALSTLEGSDF